MKIKKPWGNETIWARTNQYTGKIIKIRKGRRLSLQYHVEKAESIYVLSGRLQLYVGPPQAIRGSIDAVMAMYLLGPGKFYDIPAKTVHRFEAPYGNVELMEISVGEDKDIIRLADDYGRVE